MKVRRVIAVLSAVVLVISCSSAPRRAEEHSDLLDVDLERVSVLDALKAAIQIGSGPHFTHDSISRAELSGILVDIKLEAVTIEEYLSELGLAAGLTIESLGKTGHRFRIVRATPPPPPNPK